MERYRVTALALALCPLLATASLIAHESGPGQKRQPDPALSAEWLPVPAGLFTYGAGNTATSIDNDYAVMRYPVTNAQYVTYLQEALTEGTVTVSGDSVLASYPGDAYWPAGTYPLYLLGTKPAGGEKFGRIEFSGGAFRLTPDTSFNQHPVVFVTWFGARAFARRYNLRLPSEQEWEKAARGNTGSTYPWGNTISTGDANYQGSGDPFSEGTTPVGYYNGSRYGTFQTSNRPSPFGAYDMAGNVWGWTSSFYEGASPTHRVVRGGAWDNTTDLLRSWNRGSLPPNEGYKGVGFRCVLGYPSGPIIDSLAALSGYDNTVPLTWIRPTGSILSYNVYRSAAPGGPYTRIAEGLTRSWYRDESMPYGTQSWYVVTAVDASGEGAFSPERSAQPSAGGYRVAAGWTNAAPTLDGTITPGEWSTATRVSITYPGVSDSVTLFLMNTANTVYLAVDDKRARALPPGGGIGLFFDANHDRFWPAVGSADNEGYLTWYWDGGTAGVVKRFNAYRGVWPDSIVSSTGIDPPGVTANLSSTSGYLQYEASVAIGGVLLPVAPGDEVGLFVYAVDFQTGDFTGAWPQENASVLRPLFGDSGFRWAHGPFSFGDVRLAVPPLPAPVALAATGISTTSFTANWLQVTDATGYRLDVSADSTFATAVAGYLNLSVGTGTTALVSGLTQATRYFYRVRAEGTGGTSPNSNIVAVTTSSAPPTPPSPPLALNGSDVTSTGFTARWSAVTEATGYNLDVSTDSLFAGFIANYDNRDVGNVTSHPLTGLSAATTYHYRVRASGAGGSSQNSNVITVVTVSPPAVAAPVVLQPKSITPSGFTAGWQEVQGATNYLLDVSPDSFFTYAAGYEQYPVGNTVRHAVSGLDPETRYFYRVYAEEGTVLSAPSSGIIVTTYATDYTLSHQIAYPYESSLTDYAQGDYRLVGVPGNSALDIGTLLGGVWKEDWQIYWDNGRLGTPQDYYVQYSQGTAGFLATTGKAFWILHRGDLWLTGSAEAAPLDSNSDASIPLTPGEKWNLITNPFSLPVSWNAVAAYNGLGATALRAWRSGWTDVTEMVPYEGYLFANDSGRTLLKIPYPYTYSDGAPPGLLATTAWRIGIVARSGGYQDRTTWFGVAQEASPGMDRYEQPNPRPFADAPDVFFDRADWDDRQQEYATDIRPGTEELELWNLSVRLARRDPVELEFTGVSDVPRHPEVMLLDAARGQCTNLKEQNRVTLHPDGELLQLAVLVGPAEKVHELIRTTLPVEFALEQNFPNPFNPATRIRFSIGSDSRVQQTGGQGAGDAAARLAVYDLLGREVAVLLHERKIAGRYEVQFNGSGLASGVYFYRLTAGSHVQTRAMILAR